MKLPLAYTAIIVLLSAMGLFVVLGAFGLIPVDQVYLVMTSFVLVQVLAVIFAFIGGIVMGLFLAHRILGSRDFTPFERAILEGQAAIMEEFKELKR